MLIQLIGITKYANNTNEIKFVFFILPSESLVDSNLLFLLIRFFAANLGVMFLKSI